jgi:chromosome segregation ATPase
MARSGVTREQVFETADALVREGQNPTVVAVRTRLGGGSPNTITPLLAEWKTLNEKKQAASMPAVPEPVEAVMRQVWGAAWQQAQSQLEGEREALGTERKEIERERAEMLSEIGRMDTEMETARGSIAKGAEALEIERQAHERTKSEVREAQAIAAERAERIAAQEKELQGLRHQIEEASVQASARASRLESERDHAQADLEAVRTELRQEQESGKRLAAELQAARGRIEEADGRSGRLEADLGQARGDLENARVTLQQETEAHAAAEKSLAALRIEAATLTERAAHIEELRVLVKTLQKQQSATEDAGSAKKATRRRSKPEG